MSAALALLLAAAAAQPVAADNRAEPDRGAQIDSAHISATILRPAVIRNGVLVSSGTADQAHGQVVRSDGRVTYLFE
jgi:hypothetical protein